MWSLSLCSSCRITQGGVGRIAEAMAEGLQELGGRIEYKANVTAITTDPESGRATGVRLADGREYRYGTAVFNTQFINAEQCAVAVCATKEIGI